MGGGSDSESSADGRDGEGGLEDGVGTGLEEQEEEDEGAGECAGTAWKSRRRWMSVLMGAWARLPSPQRCSGASLAHGRGAHSQGWVRCAPSLTLSARVELSMGGAARVPCSGDAADRRLHACAAAHTLTSS